MHPYAKLNSIKAIEREGKDLSSLRDWPAFLPQAVLIHLFSPTVARGALRVEPLTPIQGG